MKIKKALRRALSYVVDVLVAVFVISLLIAASFLITGRFSFLAYSERMFWAGMITTLLAAVVGMAAGFAGRGFGIPAIIRRPVEAKRLLDNFTEYREEVEKRYDSGIKMFLVGVGCVVVSALVQTFLT